ncbi:MAG: M14 family zinc carboxypeptidase [Phycisphaerales bacterium]
MRYDGQAGVRVTVRDLREYRTVVALAEEVTSCGGSGVGTFEVRMTGAALVALAGAGVRHEVLVPDIQRHVDQIWADDAAIRAGGGVGGAADDEAWFATYRSLAEIEARLAVLALDYPQLATLSDIGPSIQGRQLKMMRITGPGSAAGRPALLIHANQHAREWVTPMCAMFIVDRLLETYAVDPRIRAVVDAFEWHIVPCVNPDGYEYSRTVNSQWRKNRRDNPGTTCDGVDLNRNWGYVWGYDNTGSSPNTCSDIYRGTGPFTEPEILPLRALSDSLSGQGRLRVHIDIHSNARKILSPWAHTPVDPPAMPLMNTIAQKIQAGMQGVRGQPYPYGQWAENLYLSNGVAPDYSYGVHGVLGWTIEMSGNSFQPPVTEILPNAREALAGMLALAEHFLPSACYPNCDGSTTAPALNVADFSCFLGRYAAGEAWANCDSSTVPPVLNVADFSCFLTRYAAGCP